MGFKSDHFFKKVDENLHCAICHEVFDNPVTCKDGHTFCNECIETWLCVQGRVRCPADNMPINCMSLVRNLAVKGILDNMDVYCDPLCAQNTEARPAKRLKIENSSNGESTFNDDNKSDDKKCCWIGKLHELETHRKTCGFQLITCPHIKCNENIKRKELEKHKETCKYRTVVCEECAACVVQHNLEKHLEKRCPNALVPCPNNCNTNGEVTKIKRIDIAKHSSDVCIKTLVNCPYKEHGCGEKVERQDVDKHVQENMAGHMMLLAKECSLLRKQNKSLTDRCWSLDSKNMEIKNELRSLTDKHAQLGKKFNQVEEEFNNQLLGSCSYTWTVSNLSDNHPNGSFIRSSYFWLHGYRWFISLYPNGERADATGFVSLFLSKAVNSVASNDTMPSTSDNELAIYYRLTVMSQKPGIEHVSHQSRSVFTSGIGNGRRKFMKASDSRSPSYYHTGKLIIKCSIEPDKIQ